MAASNYALPVSIPAKAALNINTTLDEVSRAKAVGERRMYLCGSILSIDDGMNDYAELTSIARIVRDILEINREDQGIPPDERKPIILYINSPGGEVTEGFSLVSTIKLSKTPVYTVNIGEWSSMSFLIGITGHKRLSLPDMIFLLHDGFSMAGGSSNKVQDKVDFDKKFEREVVKRHVLEHSNMKSSDYDMLARVELYMLPEDALERGFIDEIVADIDEIL